MKEVRIGYQKNGVLVIARRQATLEKHFGPQGIDVKWVEFSSGPPMMEAMNVGSIDFGAVGDSPPVFAQAAGAAIVYAAGQPITNGQGILVPQNSAIRSIADLKASASDSPRVPARTTSWCRRWRRRASPMTTSRRSI